jgi:hypothetical protein
MPVPIATVNEHDLLQPREDEIRAARKITPMQAESKAQAMRRRTHGHFWLRVLPPDAPHHPRARLSVNDIHVGCDSVFRGRGGR